MKFPAYLTTRQKWPKWNIPISPLSADYTTSGLMVRRRIPDVPKGGHLSLGDLYARRAHVYKRTYRSVVSRALGQLQQQGVDPGPLISGIVSERFPASIKVRLRNLATSTSDATNAAFAHYAAARLRLDTARNRFRSFE